MSPRPSPLTHPRGRLPARVYWIRRGLVLGTAVLLVVGFAQLLGGGGDTPPQARLAGDATTPSTTPKKSAPQTAGPYAVATGPSRTAKVTQPPLAQPDGPCEADEISVEPSVPNAKAGSAITIQVKLKTARPACTFDVAPKSLAVKVTSGSDRIWSSQDCRKAVPVRSVVVRSAAPATVPVSWSGRRSSEGSCDATHAWAKPGYYHVLAAVIGSEPADTQFKLSVPPRPVVTKTAKPKRTAKAAPTPTKTPKGTADGKDGKDGKGAKGKGSACGGDNAASSC
jgi:hypothetical protein